MSETPKFTEDQLEKAIMTLLEGQGYVPTGRFPGP